MSKLGMRWRAPFAALIGIGLIGLGIASYAAIRRWVATRIVLPVNMPISLAAGHIHTPAFRINLSTSYWVTVHEGEWWRLGRECEPYGPLQTRWTLYREGQIIGRQRDPTYYLSFFDADSGVYELDLEVLSDRKCLDAGHPYLTVTASTYNYETLARILEFTSSFCAFIGVVLLLFLSAVRMILPVEANDRITDLPSVGQNFQWAQRLRLRRPISGLPPFGTAAGVTFAVLAMLMMLLTPYSASPVAQVMWVHLLKPGQNPLKRDAWVDPLVVSVRYAGPNRSPDLYINSMRMASDDFAVELKRQLSRRRDRVVYVEGDEMVSWNDVATVIDDARGYGAKFYLMGSSTKNKR